MNLSKIKRNQIIKTPARVDEKVVFIMCPDTGLKIWNTIYDTNLFLSNCKGIVSPNKMYTVYKKKYNGRKHYLKLRKRIMENKDVARKLRVYASLPDQIKTSSLKEKKSGFVKDDVREFYFYDMSIVTDAVKDLMYQKQLPEKIAYGALIKEIQTVYNKIKYIDTNFKVYTWFHLNDSNGILYKFLINMKRYQNLFREELKNPMFDTLGFAGTHDTLIPVLERVDNKTLGIIQNINKIGPYIGAADLIDSIDKEEGMSKDETLELNEKPAESVITKIVQQLTDPESIDMGKKKIKLSKVDSTKKKTIRDVIPKDIKIKLPETKKLLVPKETEKAVLKTPIKIKATIKKKPAEPTIELDTSALSKILRSYKITDPDVVANVKAALDEYLTETGEKIPADKAELIVLKAINYTIHGTKELDPKYLKTPAALILKLSQKDIYTKKLEFPGGKLLTIEPSEIVTLKSTTGQHRQKFEFEEMIHENIKKVFGTLESQSKHPIKIKSINWDYVDTDSDRYTQYSIMLQNMTGENKKIPYEVKLKIPAPVNDKYFKLNGHNYIFLSQQHLKPLTKTDKNEARIITNYAIVRIGVQNLKFNVSDINDILEYIYKKYPNLIKDYVENEKVLFESGDIIYLKGNTVYKNNSKSIIIDEETGKLKDTSTDVEIKGNKFEFLFDILLNKVLFINPEDNLTKSKKSIPYLYIYLSGKKMPLIIYLWTQKGLLSTLNDWGIDYLVTEDKGEKGDIVVSLEGNKYLYIRPKSIRERLFVNGLLHSRPKYSIKDPEDPSELSKFLTDTYGSRAANQIDNITENLIDPVTKELLEFENLPTTLPGLVEPAVTKLLNDQQDSLADLKIYRSRMSEIVLRIIYKQLMRAHNYYSINNEFEKEDNRLMLVEDFVMNEFLSRNPRDQTVARDAVVCIQETQPVNPIEEIMLASRAIKEGPGGVPNKRAFKESHRNIHDSQHGIMSATSTKEDAKVGITVHHTLTPLIINKYGSYGAKDDKNLEENPWGIVSADEALIPFVNQIYSDRTTLAVTH